jgi:hypothetical protein
MAPAAAKPLAPAAPDKLSAVRSDMNLAADKKAAGVGFLNNLITRFKGIGSKGWGQVGNGNANRIGAGMAALARSEKDMTKAEEFRKMLGKCALCKRDEHDGKCKLLTKIGMDPPTEGLSSINHNSTLVRY